MPPDVRANKRKGKRPGWHGGLYDFMRRVLATERGSELYARRQTMIEPVFAHTKFNRRSDRFLRRGRSACRSRTPAPRSPPDRATAAAPAARRPFAPPTHAPPATAAGSQRSYATATMQLSGACGRGRSTGALLLREQAVVSVSLVGRSLWTRSRRPPACPSAAASRSEP